MKNSKQNKKECLHYQNLTFLFVDTDSDVKTQQGRVSSCNRIQSILTTTTPHKLPNKT